jgi:glycine/serine hydroxymethyltransferase
MGVSEMQHIAQCIAVVLRDYRDVSVLKRVKADIDELVSGFPVYPGLTVLE